eukprot:1906447-Rhodomonas_salina.1
MTDGVPFRVEQTESYTLYERKRLKVRFREVNHGLASLDGSYAISYSVMGRLVRLWTGSRGYGHEHRQPLPGLTTWVGGLDTLQA